MFVDLCRATLAFFVVSFLLKKKRKKEEIIIVGRYYQNIFSCFNCICLLLLLEVGGCPALPSYMCLIN